MEARRRRSPCTRPALALSLALVYSCLEDPPRLANGPAPCLGLASLMTRLKQISATARPFTLASDSRRRAQHRSGEVFPRSRGC